MSSAEPQIPKNYHAILDVVRAHGVGRHLTMAEIYAEAARARPGIGFSTVYRGLARLRDLGLVAEILVPGADAATYEPAAPAHAHFRCSECGAIADIDYTLPQRLLRALAGRHDVEIETGNVTFAGRCAACRTAAP
jgi:Fur family ferric uptake transcriptional regulator